MMAEPIAYRDVFETEPIVGIGSHLEFLWPDHTGMRYPERLEVKDWEIHEIVPAAELPMTGGYGAIQRRRVCSDFEFTADIDLDLKPSRDNDPAPGPMSQPFPGSRLEGGDENHFLIGIRFHCGDPTWWEEPELTRVARTIGELPGREKGSGVHYRCNSVIITEVWTVANSQAKQEKGVVSAIVKGYGAAPLRRYVADKWCGTGWLGWDSKFIHPEEFERTMPDFDAEDWP